jgi:phage gp29-like protein
VPTQPDVKVYRDIPALSFTEWDDPRRVRNALRTMEQSGQMQPVAMLYDALGRDDRIASCLNTRIEGLLGLPVTLTPGTEQRKAQKVADRAQKLWPRMFPRSQLAEILACGLMLGIGLGENVWTRDAVTGEWVPRLKYWHPQFLYWRWDTRSFWLITQDGTIEIPEDGANGKWFVFCPYGYYLGWRKALIRAVAIPFLIRQLAYRDWARYSEVHGLPIKGAIMPAGADKEVKDRYLSLLDNIGSEALVELEQGIEGNKYDLKLIEAQANTWEGFHGLVEQMQSSIAILMLGQNLTTEVKGGSRAAATVHNDVRIDKICFDSLSIMQTASDCTLQPWTAFNFGDQELSPAPAHDTAPPDDLGKKATQAKDLSAAIGGFQAAKAPVDVRKLLEEHQIPTLSEEDHAAQLEADADRAAAAQAAFAQQPTEEDEKDVPTPEGEPEQLSARPSAPKAIRAGQKYIDAVVAASMARARVSMKPKLALVHQVVQLSSSPEDLKRRLEQAFSHLQPDALAELLERAQVMAELAGRSVVLESL